MRILWLEDVPEEVGRVTRSLMRASHELRVARSFDEAVAYVAESVAAGEYYDLVLLDARLEEQHKGSILFGQMRRGEHGSWGKEVWVIFLTKYKESIVGQIRGIEPPPLGVIRKPLSMEEVRDCFGKIGVSLSETAVTVSVPPIQVNPSAPGVPPALVQSTVRITLFPKDLAELDAVVRELTASTAMEIELAGHHVARILDSSDENGRLECIKRFRDGLAKAPVAIREALRVSAAGRGAGGSAMEFLRSLAGM
ncbi:MAG: hypothetical protein AAB152_11370 [Candidatus Coatesbacteria bacterium]